MRVLVCGGRYFADNAMLVRELDLVDAAEQITTIIQGGAPGADTLATDWARAKGVPMVAFPADWARHGRAAGPIRNAQMLAEGRPDLVVAFPGGRGTADMVNRASRAGVEVMQIHGPEDADDDPTGAAW